MLNYSDYKSFVDTLDQSNHDNTYQELIGKEDKVLDTVNSVVKYYKDKDVKEKQFINLPVAYVVQRFFEVWSDIFYDLVNHKHIMDIVTKDDRLIYIGAMMILLSIFLYYVEITRS